MERKAQPERTCVGCRERAPKRELLRIARDRGGVVRVDPTGRAPGRGAYLHPREECVLAARRSGALARALRRSGAGVAVEPLSPRQAGRLIEALNRT